MKSILLNVFLVSSLLLISACDSSSDGRVVDTEVEIAAPSNGIRGIALSGGPTSGASLTVLDASGGEVEISSGGNTAADGSYRIVFSEGAVSAGITAPLSVSVTGGNTVCTLDRPETVEDCFIDGNWFTFGTSVPLASDFTVSAVIPNIPEDTITTDPVAEVNVSPATALATALAAAAADRSALTAEEVILSNQQVLGLMEFLVSIGIEETELWALDLFDVNDLDEEAAAAPNASFITMAFAAALFSEVNPNDASADTLNEAKARLVAQFGTTDGNLSGTGNNFARLARAMAVGMATVDAALTNAGIDRPLIRAGAQNASANAVIFATFDNNRIFPPPVDAATANIEQTRAFVANLSSIINSGVAITGAAGFGGTRIGATEVFADELDAIGLLSRNETALAIDKALDVVGEARASLSPGDTDIDLKGFGDGSVTGLISLDAAGTTLTVTNVASTATDSTTGVGVTLGIASGTRTDESSFESEAVALTRSDDDHQFTGSLLVDLAAGDDTDNTLTAFDLAGTIATGDAAEGLDVAFSAADLSRTTTTTDETTEVDIDGTFEATLTLSAASVEDLVVTFEGGIDETFDAFTLQVDGQMLIGTVMETGGTVVDVLTDGTVYLTLTRSASAFESGVFTVGTGTAAIETGSLNENGVVTYADGAIETLPAAVF